MLCRRTMKTEGFTIDEQKWWHFDFKGWRKYRLGSVTIERAENGPNVSTTIFVVSPPPLINQLRSHALRRSPSLLRAPP